MGSKKAYFSVFCVLFLAILTIQVSSRSCGAEQPSVLLAEVKIQPESYNLKYKWGSRLTCIVSFPEQFDTANVNKDEIMLENEIKAESAILLPNVVMARFNRGDVLHLLERKAGTLPAQVNLLVSGTTKDGTPFKTQGKVSVVSPPKIDLALEKQGEKVTVVAECDEQLKALKVFVEGPAISSHAPIATQSLYARETIPVEMRYEKGGKFGHRYIGNFDTSSLMPGKAMVKAEAIGLDKEHDVETRCFKVK